MRKIWLVIKREYITRVKSKGFVLATIGVPLLSAGILALSIVMAIRQTGHPLKLAIVDDAGGLGGQIGENLAGEKRNDGQPRFKIIKVLDQPTAEPGVRNSLRAQVNGGQLDGYLVIPKGLAYVEFHTKNAADFMIYGPVETAVNHAVIARRLSEQGVRVSNVAELMKGINMKVIKVSQQGESEDSGQTFVMGLILAMLLYITLIMYGVITMRSVLEEKTTRIVEVLVSAVRPFQLLFGKIIGVAAVAFTQYFIWITTGLLLATYGSVMATAVSPGASFPHVHVPVSLLIYLGIYFILGYFLYASLYASVGAASSNDQDAQQLQMVATFPLLFGFIMYNAVLRDPNSTLSFVLSEIPFFSPILMVLRITAQTPPFWQIALSIVILAITTIGVVYLSSRIYRIGILMYGKRPSLVEILRWLRYT